MPGTGASPLLRQCRAGPAARLSQEREPVTRLNYGWAAGAEKPKKREILPGRDHEPAVIVAHGITGRFIDLLGDPEVF